MLGFYVIYVLYSCDACIMLPRYQHGAEWFLVHPILSTYMLVQQLTKLSLWLSTAPVGQEQKKPHWDLGLQPMIYYCFIV